jgi:death on curing protein
MKYLSKQAVIAVNRKTIEFHGGNFVPPNNFLNESNLDYLLEIVPAEMFGIPVYHGLAGKAGVYMFNIISNHIFQDGNKRTGLESAILFLRINGFNISEQLKIDHIFDFTMKVASGQSSLEECQDWFARHIVPEYL